MKQFTRLTMLCCLSFLITESLTHAQPAGRPGQGQRGGGQGQRGGAQGRGQGMGAPRGGAGGQQIPPLLKALDSDGDGSLSTAEIDNATKALRKLDRNHDGTVSSNELRPQGMGGGRGQGADEAGGPGQGGRGQRGGQTGGPPGGGGRGQRDPGQADAAFAEQVRSLDENKDGKLVADELPEHMHKAFEVTDSDQSGSLNQAELLVLAREFRRDRLPPADQISDTKNRPVGPNGRPASQP